MGQVNLYKIDVNKKAEFRDNLCNKFEFIGEQDYSLMSGENIVYTVGTYISISKKEAHLSGNGY